MDDSPPLFEFHRHRGRYRGRPIHPLGWLALAAVLAVPQLGWLLVALEPAAPPWAPFAATMSLLGPSLWWLIRLARRRGRFLD